MLRLVANSLLHALGSEDNDVRETARHRHTLAGHFKKGCGKASCTNGTYCDLFPAVEETRHEQHILGVTDCSSMVHKLAIDLTNRADRRTEIKSSLAARLLTFCDARQGFARHEVHASRKRTQLQDEGPEGFACTRVVLELFAVVLRAWGKAMRLSKPGLCTARRGEEAAGPNAATHAVFALRPLGHDECSREGEEGSCWAQCQGGDGDPAQNLGGQAKSRTCSLARVQDRRRRQGARRHCFPLPCPGLSCAVAQRSYAARLTSKK